MRARSEVEKEKQFGATFTPLQAQDKDSSHGGLTVVLDPAGKGESWIAFLASHN